MRLAFVGDIHCTSKQPRMRVDNYSEAMFNKLTYIANQKYDAVFFLGDFFNKPACTEELENRLIKCLRIDFAGTDKYCIIGNHDFWFDNMSTFSKTALCNLTLSNEIYLKNEDKIVQYKDVSVYFMPYFSDKIDSWFNNLHFASKKVIILGHHFFEWPDNFGYSLKYDYVKAFCEKHKDIQFKIILGHDHERHDDVIGDNFTVIRPGSLMRPILKQYALTQGVNIISIDTDTFEHSLVNVKVARAPEMVFNLNSYKFNNEHKITTSEYSLNQIYKCIQQLNDCNDKKENNMYEALQNINADKDVIQYIRDLYSINNLAFE